MDPIFIRRGGIIRSMSLVSASGSLALVRVLRSSSLKSRERQPKSRNGSHGILVTSHAAIARVGPDRSAVAARQCTRLCDVVSRHRLCFRDRSECWRAPSSSRTIHRPRRPYRRRTRPQEKQSSIGWNRRSKTGPTFGRLCCRHLPWGRSGLFETTAHGLRR